MKTIGILGAGTWGTALARLFVNNGNQVIVWSAIPEEIDRLASSRVHPNLPYMTIPNSILFSKDIRVAVESKDIILCAVPSIYLRETIKKALPFIQDHSIIVDVAKGIEKDTLYTMTEVIQDELNNAEKNNRVVALSGPTHAEEVAQDMPTTIISSSKDTEAASIVQEMFLGSCIRAYTNTDVKGVEICGALKNIIALGTGISSGLGFGDNAKAALVTRGMAEITRLGIAMGCNKDTFFGLAGIGDLVVTATSQHSRNNRAGQLLGKGWNIEETLKKVGMVVEGVNALPAAIELAKRYSINMPIVDGVNRIINMQEKPDIVVKDLMNRDMKEERPY